MYILRLTIYINNIVCKYFVYIIIEIIWQIYRNYYYYFIDLRIIASITREALVKKTEL